MPAKPFQVLTVYYCLLFPGQTAQVCVVFPNPGGFLNVLTGLLSPLRGHTQGFGHGVGV